MQLSLWGLRIWSQDHLGAAEFTNKGLVNSTNVVYIFNISLGQATLKHQASMRFLIETLATIWQYLAIAIVCTIIFCIQLVVAPIEYLVYLIRTGGHGKGCPFWYSGRIFRMSSVISIRLNPLWTFRRYSKLPDEIPTGKVDHSEYNCYFVMVCSCWRIIRYLWATICRLWTQHC